MLPRFRFLFAAIVLAISMLIFGMGAAALLRAAHEEFASIPSRRPPVETMFAQRSDAEPVLAMLRAELSAADAEAIDPPTSDRAQDEAALVSAPAESETPAAEPDKIAALTETAPQVEDSLPSEIPMTETTAPEIPVGIETAEIAPAVPDQDAAPAPDAASAPIEDGGGISETRIATLGGPPVTVEARTPSKRAASVVRKPVRAKPVVKQRRIIRHARVQQPAHQRPAPQQPANLFGSPFGPLPR